MEEKISMDEKDALESLAPHEQSEISGPQELSEPQEPPHSIYPKWQRVIYVYIASVAAFASPVSSSIYYPAMLTLAKDLNTSLTKISLTITTFMVYIIPICNPFWKLIVSRYSKALLPRSSEDCQTVLVAGQLILSHLR